MPAHFRVAASTTGVDVALDVSRVAGPQVDTRTIVEFRDATDGQRCFVEDVAEAFDELVRVLNTGAHYYGGFDESTLAQYFAEFFDFAQSHPLDPRRRVAPPGPHGQIPELPGPADPEDAGPAL